MPQITRQKPLGHYIADFYCSRLRLVIGLDGDSHFGDRAEQYDARRTESLEEEGIRVVRFTNTDVMQSFEGVCEAILKVLQENR